MAPDIMHDILEGVLQVLLIMILKDVVIRKSFLRIQQLNDRIKSFCYGPVEATNRPSLIKETGFSDANDIKQSGKILIYALYTSYSPYTFIMQLLRHGAWQDTCPC